mgnify:CR=1 FL=1
MSKFNISYNIVAIDRFSRVAKSVEQKALQMQKVMRNTIDSNIDRQTLLGKTYARTSDVVKGYSKMPTFNFKAPLTSFSNFLGKINILSYRSFRQMMYTALPLLAIFKRPFEDLVSLQKNSIILTNAIGTSGANAVGKINTAISKTTLMSKASLTDASRILTQNGASVDQIRRLMPVISDMTASSGGNSTPSQTASQLNTMLRSSSSQSVNGMIIQGSTVADRLESLLTQYSMIQGTAEKQANTPTGKLVKSFMLLSDSLRQLLTSAAPAFNMLSNIINGVANVVSNLANKHKNLANVIIGFVGIVLTVIAALLTFKAVEMGVLMLTKGLTYGMLIADKAFTVISTTIRITRAAMLLLNAAFLANPIGVLIGAMVILGTVLYIANQKFAIVRKVVNAIGNAFMSVVNGGMHIFATAMSWLIKKSTEGFALILHAVGYFSSDAEKWANSLDKVTNSWDKIGNAQKKVISNHKNMNSTASMGNMFDNQKIINQTIGIKDNPSQSSINNVNVHLYQNGNKSKTYKSNQRETSVYDIDNSDVYAMGNAMMGSS